MTSEMNAMADMKEREETILTLVVKDSLKKYGRNSRPLITITREKRKIGFSMTKSKLKTNLTTVISIRRSLKIF